VTIGRLTRVGAVTLACGLAGCTTYHALPLPERPNLAPGLAQLNLNVPSQDADKPDKLDPAKPLTPDQVGMLAVVNSPDMAVERAKIAVAGADLLEAKILPNPSVGLGYASLVSAPPGAAIADAMTASISQDIQSIVTYSAHVDSAEAKYRQVSVDALWAEWQVAQKARLLAIGINSEDREMQYREAALALLRQEVKDVEAATAAGNLDLTAEAPLLASLAIAERDLATLRLQELQDWQGLDTLLGLQPTARFAIAAPEAVKVPKDIDGLIASLPSRRPDLVALRLGYDAAEADVRAAILAQFPAFSLGVAGGSDTSEVVSVGPQITFDLPIFNRNQGKIASARADRQQMHAEYQTRLDDAEGTARSLLVRAHTVQADLERASTALDSAAKARDAAESAYHQGNIDQRALSDYQSAALDRQVDVIDYERTLQEDSLALSVELGLGFPRAMLATPDRETSK
jgi:outer membrane protein TolC